MTDSSDEDCLAELQLSALTKAIWQANEPVADASFGTRKIKHAEDRNAERHQRVGLSSYEGCFSLQDDVRMASNTPFSEQSQSAKAPEPRRVVKVKAVRSERTSSITSTDVHCEKRRSEPGFDKLGSSSEVRGLPDRGSPVQMKMRAINGESIRRPARRFKFRQIHVYDHGKNEINLHASKGQDEVPIKDVTRVPPGDNSYRFPTHAEKEEKQQSPSIDPSHYTSVILGGHSQVSEASRLRFRRHQCLEYLLAMRRSNEAIAKIKSAILTSEGMELWGRTTRKYPCIDPRYARNRTNRQSHKPTRSGTLLH